MSRKLLTRYGAVVLVCFAAYRLIWLIMPNICNTWELQLGDQLLRLAYFWQGKRETSPDIVYVDLDDASISTLQYDKNDPLLYADLIGIISRAGARSILLDMMFPQCRKNGCEELAKQVRSAANVHLATILSTSGGEMRKADRKVIEGNVYLDLEIASRGADQLIRGETAITNFPGLDQAAAGIGHINFSPDPDGVYRRIPLLIRTPSGVAPSLGLRVALQYLNHPVKQVVLEPCRNLTLQGALLPDGSELDLHIPISCRAENRISFSGLWEDTFAHYSFETIIKKGSTPTGRQELVNELEDSLVIVTDVSTGGRDFGPVPLAAWYPLSGAHGNLINSILNNDFITELPAAKRLWVDLSLFLILVAAAYFTRGARFILLATTLFFGALLAAVLVFVEYRVMVPIVRPSLSLVTGVLAILHLQYLEEQKEKQRIRSTLTSYFAPSLMEKILNDPDLIKGVSRKKLTVLFSDIVGFTSWSSTRDPGEIHQTLNHYFQAMAEIVFAHDGTIDKFIGDGLMVFFGDPLPTPDHALNAVRAARRMQEKTAELREAWQRSGGMNIRIRIGIHTGEVVVGNMGSSSRMEYTVIGSNVNLAQRLESNCPPGGILISEQVKEELGGRLAISPAGMIKVKGFDEPLTVYTVDM